MYSELKKKVLVANLFLQKNKLVKLTWGNVSEVDYDLGVIAIKPSGVSYDEMKVSDIVVVDLDGNVVEGDLNPSSDLKTHVEIYKKYPEIKGITHTHSTYATAWAQANRSIPFYGTTHADHFHGPVPISRQLTDDEINGDYEKMTGVAICESLANMEINPIHNPAILVPNHAPFIFGTCGYDSAKNALVLEEVAKMAYLSESINGEVSEASKVLGDKHFYRKHGENSYYGQK